MFARGSREIINFTVIFTLGKKITNHQPPRVQKMKHYKFYSAFFCSLLLQTQAHALATSKVDELAHSFMQEQQIDGMSLAVVQDGKSKIYNYGFADKANNVRTTSDTIYTIASFTKTITAALSAVASVEGKVDLNKPFINYFPAVKHSKNLKDITSSQLLGHVSSMPFDFSPRPTTFTELVNQLKEFKPSYKPGSEYSYSNAGIGTMGYVLQNVYAKPYEEILQEKLLTPLNMTSTYLSVPADKEKFIAVAHEKDNTIVPYSKTTAVWFAAASLKSTIHDMANYLAANIEYQTAQNTTLSDALALVHANKYCFTGGIACEQLAWQAHRISELDKSTGDTCFLQFDKNGFPTFCKKQVVPNPEFGKQAVFIDKTGSGYGMSSYMVYIPGKKVGVVLLLNKNVGDERIQFVRSLIQQLG